MKWIPKYQKAGKLNFKTTGLPWQQSKEDQEVARHAQFVEIPNPTNLKSRLQPASKNLKAKYNNLSTKERLALAKKSMPHSEIITVKDQQGNTKTDTNPQAGAMSGADPVGEFIVGTAAGNLGLGLGKMALSKMGQNAVSHWARNSLLNETAGNLTKNISQGVTNNLAAKEYTAGDNPIMQLSYYKPTRKAWSTGNAEGNRATSYFFKQQPNQRFELVKDVEPNNYSVHFKTDRNGLNYGNKMQLFAKVADEVPEGANLSTWGSISKGGIHGVNRFGKDFGFIQNGTRQLTMKGSGEPVNVGVFQKPHSGFQNKANQFTNTQDYPKLDQDVVRLYRASGTNGKFTPSEDGTAKYAGMWFTNDPKKTLIYASNTRRKAIKEGIDNPIELQYIDIPKTQLEKYKAFNIIGKDPNVEYEVNEDFLIPLDMKRNRVPLEGITGNMLRDTRLPIPKLDPNIFRIATPIGMILPFLNNSQK